MWFRIGVGVGGRVRIGWVGLDGLVGVACE